MKTSFFYSRKIIVPVDDYKNIHYELGAGREYSNEEMQLHTIIPEVEFKELAEIVDKTQRDIIRKDSGVTNLIIDKMKAEVLRNNRSKFPRRVLQKE